jgi:NADH dehydrogenase FAD-containing subunit
MNHYDLLLIGAGHAHLGVLRRWALLERPPGRIGLLSAGPAAWYSGMLPGLLAGRYAAADCQVELTALCRAAKVELLVNPVAGLSAAQQQVQLADGRTLGASWLSLNVGAQVSAPPQQGDAMQVLAVKPFAEFLAGWQQWQAEPQPLAILGGGAAGVELARLDVVNRQEPAQCGHRGDRDFDVRECLVHDRANLAHSASPQIRDAISGASRSTSCTAGSNHDRFG